MSGAANPKTIGNMNGPWALLLKAALFAFPVVMAFGVWNTKTIYDHDAQLRIIQDTRFKQSDGMALEAKMTERIQTSVDRMAQKIDALRDEIKRLP